MQVDYLQGHQKAPAAAGDRRRLVAFRISEAALTAASVAVGAQVVEFAAAHGLLVGSWGDTNLSIL